MPGLTTPRAAAAEDTALGRRRGRLTALLAAGALRATAASNRLRPPTPGAPAGPSQGSTAPDPVPPVE